MYDSLFDLLIHSPRYMQDALCDVLKGYKPASVVRIPNAGHLVNIS